MKDFDEISKILKEVKDALKKEKGVLFEDLAEKCGLTPPAFNNILIGKTKNPGVRIIYNLLNYFKVNPGYFFFKNAPLFIEEVDNKAEPRNAAKENAELIALQTKLEAANSETNSLLREKIEFLNKIDQLKDEIDFWKNEYKKLQDNNNNIDTGTGE